MWYRGEVTNRRSAKCYDQRRSDRDRNARNRERDRPSVRANSADSQTEAQGKDEKKKEAILAKPEREPHVRPATFTSALYLFKDHVYT